MMSVRQRRVKQECHIILATEGLQIGEERTGGLGNRAEMSVDGPDGREEMGEELTGRAAEELAADAMLECVGAVQTPIQDLAVMVGVAADGCEQKSEKAAKKMAVGINHRSGSGSNPRTQLRLNHLPDTIRRRRQDSEFTLWAQLNPS